MTNKHVCRTLYDQEKRLRNPLIITALLASPIIGIFNSTFKHVDKYIFFFEARLRNTDLGFM